MADQIVSIIWCSVTSLPDEHRIHLKVRQNDQLNVYKFSVGVEDCPAPYAVFLALTDFLDDHAIQSPVTFHVEDLFVFNVLSDYLKRWKQSNWITSTGQPVHYVDILSEFYDAIVQHNLSYRVVFDR